MDFQRFQASRLRVVTVDYSRNVHHVRGKTRFQIKCIRRALRRVNRLLLTNLPITNGNRLSFRQNVFYRKSIAYRYYCGDRPLHASWLRRKLCILSGGQDFGDRFVEGMQEGSALRTLVGIFRLRVQITTFARISSTRYRRFQFSAHRLRCPMSRSIHAQISARGSFFLGQLCRLVASVGIKGPVALSLGAFVVSMFGTTPYFAYRQYGITLSSASR